ncbi:relaxase domain-containing protein [Sinomonas sp. ASV486]|uniref:relaxase domain-containing protein n=1 Tax=Sinomonas sp. ASV486 TaxID=3051170 RepID=UPI00387EAB6B
MWAVADAGTQAPTAHAHRAAVAEAVAFVEREVAATRIGATGADGAVAQVEAAGVSRDRVRPPQLAGGVPQFRPVAELPRWRDAIHPRGARLRPGIGQRPDASFPDLSPCGVRSRRLIKYPSQSPGTDRHRPGTLGPSEPPGSPSAQGNPRVPETTGETPDSPRPSRGSPVRIRQGAPRKRRAVPGLRFGSAPFWP